MMRGRTGRQDAAGAPGLSDPIEDLVWRVEGEFKETPGLQLTLAEAQRLFGLEPTICQAILELLCAEGVLRRTAGGFQLSGGGTPPAQ